jgi:DNA repair exonuclease SbcCD ATPase subunit
VLQAERSQLEQLTGSLRVLSERRQVLVETHGSLEQLADQLAPLEESLARLENQLQEVNSQLKAAEGPGVGAERGAIPLDRRQRDLEAEKDQLLTRCGQNQERCRSLGAGDPAAAMERSLAEWETAEAERQAIERQTEALTLLSQTFRQVRGDLALRYSEPLQQAIGDYLQELAAFSPELGFDPDQGFRNLRLRQGAQSYGFDQLSGGMREQLSAALRLALADVLRGAYDNCLPLVFDDAFTAADPNRLEGVQRMLRRGADQGMQIILLSCTPSDYDTLMAGGGSRIELKGDPEVPA